MAAQDFADFEVLVLDNASTDRSFEAAAAAAPDPRFRFVPMGANLGFAAANNRGAAMANGRWLACLNPDAFPHSDWLSALLRATRRHPAAGMFASRQLDAERPELLDGAGDCYHAFGLAWRGGHGRPAPATLRETRVFGACGAAALYDRATFLELGGFAEEFFCYFEDVDLAFRWRLSGGFCVFIPDAVVEHVGGACSDGASGFARYHGTRNAVWCFLRNMPGPLLWLLPAHAALMLALLAWGAARGHGRVVARALIDALAGLPAVWTQRKHIQAGRRASWTCLAASLVWNPAALLSRPVRPGPPGRLAGDPDAAGRRHSP